MRRSRVRFPYPAPHHVEFLRAPRGDVAYDDAVDEVRRSDDDELCGFVVQRSDGWHAVAVFGGTLMVHPTRSEAEAKVLADGLRALMERWLLVDGTTGDEQIVCIQEANPLGLTVALDYYSMPGVPTLRITRAELDERRWVLRAAS